MIGIVGKKKTEKRFKSFDYKSGQFVTNVIFQTMWDDTHRDHVNKLVEYLNKNNPDYEFKIIKRGE